MEKYKELYHLSERLLFEEQNRFTRIDQKAAWYLSALTILMGITSFFGNWMLEKIIPPTLIISWLILLVGVLYFISIVFAWYFLFSALKVHKTKKIPLDSEVFKLFQNHSLNTVYYTLAKGNKNARIANIKTTDLKAKKLTHGYWSMIVSLILLVIFTVLIATYNWNINSQIYNNKGACTNVI